MCAVHTPRTPRLIADRVEPSLTEPTDCSVFKDPGESVTNPHPGLRASAELLALADALAELAEDAGRHALARHAGRVAARFTDQVLDPLAGERQLARRRALDLLRPAVAPTSPTEESIDQQTSPPTGREPRVGPARPMTGDDHGNGTTPIVDTLVTVCPGDPDPLAGRIGDCHFTWWAHLDDPDHDPPWRCHRDPGHPGLHTATDPSHQVVCVGPPV